MSDVFAPFTLPLRREGDAAILDANGKTVLVVDPDRDLEDNQATAISDYVFAALTPPADEARQPGPVAWRIENTEHAVKFWVGNQGFTVATKCEDDEAGHLPFMEAMLRRALGRISTAPSARALRDTTLEEAATICEDITSWGLSPTKAEVAKSTQTFCAKAIRAQKSEDAQ